MQKARKTKKTVPAKLGAGAGGGVERWWKDANIFLGGNLLVYISVADACLFVLPQRTFLALMVIPGPAAAGQLQKAS